LPKPPISQIFCRISVFLRFCREVDTGGEF
jgi:hypothetical protein